MVEGLIDLIRQELHAFLAQEEALIQNHFVEVDAHRLLTGLKELRDQKGLHFYLILRSSGRNHFESIEEDLEESPLLFLQLFFDGAVEHGHHVGHDSLEVIRIHHVAC